MGQVREALIFVGTAHTAKRSASPIALLGQPNEVAPACEPSLPSAPSQGRRAEANDRACAEREMEIVCIKFEVSLLVSMGRLSLAVFMGFVLYTVHALFRPFAYGFYRTASAPVTWYGV